MRNRHQIHLSTSLPAAIRGAVRAEAPKLSEIVANLNTGFDDFKKRYDGELRDVEAALNEKIALAGMNTGGFDLALRAPDPEYSGAFASYFRKGDGEADIKAANAMGNRARIQAAMSVGTADQGGYLAPVEWDRRISKAQLAVSPMRRLATVQNTTTGAYSTLWNTAVWGSGWVGETAARPETTTPTLQPITFATGEIYANPAITQRLVDDADFNAEQWLADQVATEFARQEGIAFLSGDGVNKPRGFLSYVTGGASATTHPGGVLGVTTVASATAITADELVTFSYSLGSPYRQGAVWLMNSTTAATIAKIKTADGDGRPTGNAARLSGRDRRGHAEPCSQRLCDRLRQLPHRLSHQRSAGHSHPARSVHDETLHPLLYNQARRRWRLRSERDQVAEDGCGLMTSLIRGARDGAAAIDSSPVVVAPTRTGRDGRRILTITGGGASKVGRGHLKGPTPPHTHHKP